MNKKQCLLINERILNDYRSTILFYYKPGQEGGLAYINYRYITLEESYRDNPTEWSLFTTLHEIGHIMTNNNKQKRYYQEYLATQWAIDKSKYYGIEVSQSTIDTYQRYIYKWRETSIKRKGKGIHSIQHVTLRK